MEFKMCLGIEKKKRIKPVDYFKRCPKCNCELIVIDPDVLCSTCDWDSTLWDVSRGAMDNMITASKEQELARSRPRKKGDSEALDLASEERGAS